MFFIEMTSADLDWFLEIRNECRQWLHCSKEFTPEECRAWFLTLDPDSSYYLCIEDSGERIGYFRVKKISPEIWEVGADLHKDYRGQGLGYKAWREFLQWAPRTIILEVLGDNIRALNLYLRLGFTVEGAHEIMRNGRYEVSVEMELQNT